MSNREVWAEIDARHRSGEVTALDVVAGLPLLVRVLKTCSLIGWRGARVLVGEDETPGVLATLARYKLNPAFLVEVDIGDSESPIGHGGEGVTGGRRLSIRLDARAIYDRDVLVEAASAGMPVSPIMAVRNPHQLVSAQRELLRRTKKNIVLDGVVAYFVMRPLSRLLTRALVNTRLSQHWVTMCALATGLFAAFLAASGERMRVAAAGCAYFATGILDCVDGDLARLRLAPSRLGAWLDSLTDEAVTFFLVLGLGVGLWRAGAGEQWLWLGLGVTAVGVASVSRLYVDLARLGLPIDTAVYPWFFLARSKGYPPVTPFGKLLFAAGFLIRRDANVTVIAVLLLFGQQKVALVAIGTVVSAVALLLCVHLMVSEKRR